MSSSWLHLLKTSSFRDNPGGSVLDALGIRLLRGRIHVLRLRHTATGIRAHVRWGQAASTWATQRLLWKLNPPLKYVRNHVYRSLSLRHRRSFDEIPLRIYWCSFDKFTKTALQSWSCSNGRYKLFSIAATFSTAPESLIISDIALELPWKGRASAQLRGA